MAVGWGASCLLCRAFQSAAVALPPAPINRRQVDGTRDPQHQIVASPPPDCPVDELTDYVRVPRVAVGLPLDR